MCLWNGLIAAAPGHPVLAKAIETVVNQVRNRFTSVDVDATFCPNPELSVLHAYDTLFTAGPCLLGSTLNRVLGRHGQQSFVPGELNPWTDFTQRQRAMHATSLVVDLGGGTGHADTESSLIDPSLRIPGRIVLLHQNKWDMGAHRFTLVERNLVVAATDLPEANDLEAADAGDGGNDDKNDKTVAEDDSQQTQQRDHYSKTHAKVGVYGLEHLYANQERARENIRLIIKGETVAKKLQAAISSSKRDTSRIS